MVFRAAVAAIIMAATLGATVVAALAQTTPPPRTIVHLKATLSGHTKDIFEFAFSPDSETVATGSSDGRVRLWNTRTGALQATLNYADRSRWGKIAWSPNGQTIVINDPYGDRGPQIWDVRTAKMKAELATSEVWDLTWSPDGRMLLTTYRERIAELWETETGRLIAVLEQDPPCPELGFWKRLASNTNCTEVTYVTAHFDAAGLNVITASSEHPAKLWDAATGKLKTIMPLRGEEFAEKSYQSDVVLSPDRRLVARYVNNRVALLDTSTGEVKRELGQIGLPMAFSPDSKMLLTSVRKPTYSSFGKWDEFKLYDVATGQLRLIFERSYLIVFRKDLHWSQDGHTILVGGGGAELLDVGTGKVRGSLKYGGCVSDSLIGDDNCQPYTLSADGRIVIKGKNPLRLWSAENGELLTTLETARSPAMFSPTNPRLLITRGKDKTTALLWEVAVN